MLRLLILGGLAAGAFFAWKKFTSSREDEDLAEDMYGSAARHQGESQGTAPV
jgi:hypothetical protein